MRKILYIVSTLKKSGPTSQLFNIIKNLDRNLFEPYLITLSPETLDSRWNDYELINVNMESLGLSRIKGVFYAKFKLKKLVDKISPDLIHSQGVRADVLNSKLSSKKFLKICTVRNFPQLDYKMTYGLFLGIYFTYVQVKAFRSLNLCCCVSDAVANNLKVEFNIKKIKTIRNGVDNVFFSEIGFKEKVAIREKLSLPKNAVIWLSSIGKDSRKNSDFIVQQFMSFLDLNSHHILVFIGDGELVERCRILAKNSPQVYFVGRIENVQPFFQASDYFVSASKAEGMPNAVLEAMASGLPVFLSNIEPHKEIKKISPEGVFLFSLNSEEKELSILLSNHDFEDYKSQSRHVLLAVKEQLSSIIMSQCYQKVYTDLLNSHNKCN